MRRPQSTIIIIEIVSKWKTVTFERTTSNVRYFTWETFQFPENSSPDKRFRINLKNDTKFEMVSSESIYMY